jgi:hypothetical protein
MSPVRSVTYVSGPDPQKNGGEGGIRTPDTVSRTLAFEASAFNHSATSPRSFDPLILAECGPARLRVYPACKVVTI